MKEEPVKIDSRIKSKLLDGNGIDSDTNEDAVEAAKEKKRKQFLKKNKTDEDGYTTIEKKNKRKEISPAKSAENSRKRRSLRDQSKHESD